MNKVSANVDEHTHKVLSEMAADGDRTISAQVRRVLRQWALSVDPVDTAGQLEGQQTITITPNVYTTTGNVEWPEGVQ